MYRKFIVSGLLVVLLLVVVGCSEQASKKAAISQESIEELYGQITTDMSYDEAMQVMEGHDPFLKTEGAIDTPAGQITTDNVSWKLGKSVITVIFQDKVVIGKDLSTTP